MKRSGIVASVLLAGCYGTGVALAQHDMEHMGHEGMKMQKAPGVKLNV